MARKPETAFIASVHKHLPATLHYEKMANPYRGGTADTWYSGKLDMWIEYKFIPRIPKESAILPDCSQLQLDWLRDRYTEGRRVFVVLGCPQGGFVYKDRTWEHPISPKEYNVGLYTRKQLAEWIVATVTGESQDTRRVHEHSIRAPNIQDSRTPSKRGRR